MKKRLACRVVLFILLLPALSGSLGARTPAVVVVELALGDPSKVPAPCSGVSIRPHAVYLDGHPAGETFPMNDEAGHIFVSSGLQRLEDASTILLLRTPQTCLLMFGARRGTIPALQAWGFSEGAVRRWRVDDDGGIHLSGRYGLSLAPGSGAERVSRAGSRLRVFNYGRLELYRGRYAPRTTSAAPGGAATIRFAGPGDVARFRLHASQAGSLIIERTPGNMPWLTMRIGRSKADLSHRGMITLPAGGAALVELRYDGFGPADLDVGFLFTPDMPLSCRLTVGKEHDRLNTVRLKLTNESGAAVFVHKPSPGTVTWLANGEPVAVARPGRRPPKVVLAPGESLDYTVRLRLPGGQAPTSALVDLGPPYGEFPCKGSVQGEAVKGRHGQ